MDDGWTTCVRTITRKDCGKVCGRPVKWEDVPINKMSCTGAKCRPYCAVHRKSIDDMYEKRNTAPTKAHLQARKRGSEKAKDSKARKEKNKRANKRKTKKGSSVRGHTLVAYALRTILKYNWPGDRFIALRTFGDAKEVRDWFDAKAKSCGFPGGIEDYGVGAKKWTVGHKIPKHAYDGRMTTDLIRCNDRRNMTCQTRSANAKQGRKFNEFEVHRNCWPIGWGREPPTKAERARIMTNQAHLDEPESEPEDSDADADAR